MFNTQQNREIARLIHIFHSICDDKLKGVTMPFRDQILHFHSITGHCRLLPKEAVVLVLVNEQGAGTAFGFVVYPEILNDISGNLLLKIPVGGRWYFSDSFNSPDPRYRKIAKRFANAGYLEAELDGFAPRSL